MNRITTSQNRISELRMRMGFPKDADKKLQFALLLALTPMYVLRHKLGVRMVGIPRIAALFFLVVCWGAALSVFGRDEDHTFDDVFRPMWLLGIGLIAIGLTHRIVRWTKRLTGERLHAQSLGISLISSFIPKAVAERYLDPLLAIGTGIALTQSPLHYSWKILGAWLILTGLALYGVEKYLHEMQLDITDGLLHAEALEMSAQEYRDAMDGTNVEVVPEAPLSTGIDPDLAEVIARERQRRASASSPEYAASETAAAAVQRTDIQSEAQMHLFEPAPHGPAANDSPYVAANSQVPPTATGATGSRAEAGWIRALPPPVRPYAVHLLLAIAGAVMMATILTDEPAAKRADYAPNVVRTVTVTLPDPRYENSAALPDMGASAAAAEAPQVPRAPEDGGFVYPAIPMGAEAEAQMADDFYSGTNGMIVDRRHAAGLYEGAARTGSLRAKVRLAQMYEAGEGELPKNLVMARALYQEAAEAGNPAAQYALGMMYVNGTGGLTAGLEPAVRLFALSARQGHPDGQFAINVIIDSARKGDVRLAELLAANQVAWQP